MTCDIFHINKEDLECRKLIMHSIECALKRGDEVFDRLMQKDPSAPNTVSFDKFKGSLKKINHENLKNDTKRI